MSRLYNISAISREESILIWVIALSAKGAEAYCQIRGLLSRMILALMPLSWGGTKALPMGQA